MQQIIKKLPRKIPVRSSTRKSELQTKEFVLTDLHVDEWLETENQVQEMAVGCGSTKANPGQNKTKSNLNKLEWFKETYKKGYAQRDSCKFRS